MKFSALAVVALVGNLPFAYAQLDCAEIRGCMQLKGTCNKGGKDEWATATYCFEEQDETGLCSIQYASRYLYIQGRVLNDPVAGTGCKPIDNNLVGDKTGTCDPNADTKDQACAVVDPFEDNNYLGYKCEAGNSISIPFNSRICFTVDILKLNNDPNSYTYAHPNIAAGVRDPGQLDSLDTCVDSGANVLTDPNALLLADEFRCYANNKDCFCGEGKNPNGGACLHTTSTIECPAPAAPAPECPEACSKAQTCMAQCQCDVGCKNDDNDRRGLSSTKEVTFPNFLRA